MADPRLPEIRTTGRTIHVPANGNLQAALDAANGGDRITLEPRATYRGPFRLRKKSTDGWIVVMSAGSIAEQGSHDALLAKGGIYSRLYQTQKQLDQ